MNLFLALALSLTPAEHAAAATPSVAIVNVKDAQGKWSNGTAFVVGRPGILLTCKHVTDPGVEFQLLDHTGKSYDGKALYHMADSDLTILSVPGFPGPPLPVAEDTPLQGAAVAAIGHPKSFSFSVAGGVVSNRSRIINMPGVPPLHCWQTDIAINPGNSGGPVLDSKGYVVGVMGAMHAEARGIAFAYHPIHVRRLVGHTILVGPRPEGQE